MKHRIKLKDERSKPTCNMKKLCNNKKSRQAINLTGQIITFQTHSL